jgi:hypothetical protein
MTEKRELSEIQKYAIRAARERAVEAQNFLNKILSEILREHDIPEADIAKWQFTSNFSYLEKINREPELTIPSNKKKGG